MTHNLAMFYEGWETQNNRLLKVLAPLTPEQLLLRSAPHMWKVSELVGHTAHFVGAHLAARHDGDGAVQLGNLHVDRHVRAPPQEATQC